MRLSLRARVITIFSLTMAVAISAVIFALLSNAREAVRAETSASMALAKRFSVAAIGAVTQSHEASTVLADLPIHLQHPRHVRITILDQLGNPTGGKVVSPPKETEEAVTIPTWFFEWISPSAEIVKIPVMKDQRPLGYVVITTNPYDEIAEVWEDFMALFIIMAGGCALALVALYWALGQALTPLSKISKGLQQLEAGNYTVQIPEIHVPDLANIGTRFNALASELHRATKEKEHLNHQLMTVQDVERKNIAHELHDEFGPCLFGINVDANFIKTTAQEKLNGAAATEGEKIAERADAILKIVDHIQSHNRALLHRLRPMAIGHFGLPQLLEQLVQDHSNKYEDVDWSLEVSDNLTSGGESFDLTLYRMIQECLTNILRHAEASKVSVVVNLTTQDGSSIVKVAIKDNGKGIPSNKPPGIGISGMQHRITALGGSFSIKNNKPAGTIVSAIIPYSAHNVLAGSIDPASVVAFQEGAIQ